MSSSPAHVSAQDAPSFGAAASNFTRRHLQLLRGFSTRTPLRVIAHIDLDAFYAQCEMVRLNTPRDQPLAVQQWESLIAVNYAAREFNISRMISAMEAKKRCPQLMTPHVATFREGEGGKWVYREEGDQNLETDKVSLDPYRAESKKILEVIKAALLAWARKIDQRGCGEGKDRDQDLVAMVRVEKAGIDEVFVDLSALVYGTLVERYPVLQDLDGLTDPNEILPLPPTTLLEWRGDDELVDLDVGETEEDDPDWDDMAMLAGAEIIRAVRLAVWERLKYTCSGGIARNKMLAKLGSACNKPNKQTIVRNRAVQQFLSGFKFTKIRMLGGKLGRHVVALFGCEDIGGLLQVPLGQLKAKLDDDTGTWLYNLIRGNEHSEVNPRTDVKSMLSTKSFRPYLESSEQAQRWLRIFVADIYGRLVEEGLLEHKRRPKTITIHHRQAGQSRSRRIPIPSGTDINEDFLFDLAKTLLALVVAEGKIWPCANLSLTVSGFEDGVAGSQNLETFFSRQKNSSSGDNPDRPSSYEFSPPAKKRRISEIEPSLSHIQQSREDLFTEEFNGERNDTIESDPMFTEGWPLCGHEANSEYHEGEAHQTADFDLAYTCSRCSKRISEIDRDEHEDWHFAMDLDREERRPMPVATPQASSNKRQTRLAFG
jgi:DNA polymerase eta